MLHITIKTFFVSLLLALVGCAENPVTGRQNLVLMSAADEVRAGREADADIRKEYGVYSNATLQQYVDRVGQRVARISHRGDLTYRFTVLDSPETNAFALPGGYVYITRGMLAYLSSEAELAAVLAHEIGHVTARHAVQQQSAATAANLGITLGSIFLPELRSQAAQTLLGAVGGSILSGYGREHELEADRLGAEYLARAGYNPQAMIRVIGVLKDQETFDAQVARQEGREPRRYHGLFETHPRNDARLQQLVGEANRYAQAGREENAAAYLNQLNGVIFGDSPEQGVVREGKFLHEGLDFVLDFPNNWRVQNRPERVSAISPGGDAMLQMLLAERRSSPQEVLRAGLRLDNGGSIQNVSINNLPAALASGTMQGRPVRAAAIDYRNRIYVVVGTARSADAFNRYRGQIDDTIRSFRPLQASERRLARPLVLRTIQARANMSYAALAQNSPIGRNAEGYLRLINHDYPNGEPRPGEILKVVE